MRFSKIFINLNPNIYISDYFKILKKQFKKRLKFAYLIFKKFTKSKTKLLHSLFLYTFLYTFCTLYTLKFFFEYNERINLGTCFINGLSTIVNTLKEIVLR